MLQHRQKLSTKYIKNIFSESEKTILVKVFGEMGDMLREILMQILRNIINQGLL